MDEDMNNLNLEEDDNIIELNDDEGNAIKFEFLDLIKYEDEDYVVLLPVPTDDGESEEDNEVVILKLESTEDEDTESYVSIDDEATLTAVFEIFKEKFKDEFNFED